MLSLKILLPIILSILIYQESTAVNIHKIINKRSTEVSRNVQSYSFNQNHPPFSEEYAPIPVSIVYEEPPRSRGKSIITTERAPTTFHPKYRNLVVVSADVARETSTLNLNDEETRSTLTLGNTDNIATPTVDGETNIQVKTKFNVENELQIPVAVIYDDEYTNLKGIPNVLKADPNKIQDDQRQLKDVTKLDSNSESKNQTVLQRTRSYDKVISRRKSQSPEGLKGSTEQISTVVQPITQKAGSSDNERVPVKAKTQQQKQQRPRNETENTTGGATALDIDSNANSDTRSKMASSKSNQNDEIRFLPRRKLQPKATVVNETATEILNDKTSENKNNLDHSKVISQRNQHTIENINVKVDNDTVLSGASPQRRRRPIISNLEAEPPVTQQIANKNSDKVLQDITNSTYISRRRPQLASNPKPLIKLEITDQDTIKQTTIKDKLPEAITQEKEVSTEFLTTERIQNNYQTPPHRKQLSITSNSLNAKNISEKNTGGETIKKGTGFPAIVSTTNSRTQPQRRRQPVRKFKDDVKSDDPTPAIQAKDIEHKETVPYQPPSLTTAEITKTGFSGNGSSEATKKSRKRDPVVPIIESKNNVYGNTGEFHYSYESGDGTKHYGDGVLKPFDEDVNGEAVVGGFSYTDKEGNDFSLTYTADENGYRPVGAHLPTPPPIPNAIARALAYLATKTTPAEYDEVTESL